MVSLLLDKRKIFNTLFASSLFPRIPKYCSYILWWVNVIGCDLNHRFWWLGHLSVMTLNKEFPRIVHNKSHLWMSWKVKIRLNEKYFFWIISFLVKFLFNFSTYWNLLKIYTELTVTFKVHWIFFLILLKIIFETFNNFTEKNSQVPQ